MEKQAEQPQTQANKPKRNRKFHKEIISETNTELQLRVKHIPYKGDKISDTVRKDHKFNPNVRRTDLNGKLL